MIKTVSVDVLGKTYYLLYNIDAMFAAEEKYGEDFSDKVSGNGKESWETALGVFMLLAEQGELARRYCGYPQGNIFNADDARWMAPADWLLLKTAIFAAITLGLNREIPSMEDTDLTLVEFEKKTDAGQSVSNI